MLATMSIRARSFGSAVGGRDKPNRRGERGLAQSFRSAAGGRY